MQQFQPGRENINVEMDTVKAREIALKRTFLLNWSLFQILSSNARVFVCFMGAEDMKTVLDNAFTREMVSRKYVWLCSDGCASTDVFYDDVSDNFGSL